MNLIERVIRALIYIACVVLCYYLIIWVLAVLGIAIPAMVAKIIGLILALFCILMLVRLFSGGWGSGGPNSPGPGWRWFP